MTPFYIGNFGKGQIKYSRRNIILNISLGVLIIFSIFVYLIEVNSVSAYSFKTETLKQRIQELEAANQAIEIKLGKLESMNNLDSWAKEMKLVKVAQANYLAPVAMAVAAAR